MSKDSFTDYLGCILLKGIGWFARLWPVSFSLFLGRRAGDLIYWLDLRHKALAYAHIKQALGGRKTCVELRKLTREFYQGFGQNLTEIFLIPSIDKEYVKKYVRFQGLEHIEQGFREGKGVILLGVHSGSWELSNVICAALGFPFNLLVRDQQHPRLNELLNKYRTRHGCKIIQRQNQVRDLVKALKNNEAIGMTLDQGGKSGTLVEFFGKEASMATGAVRLALKYDSPIIPTYFTRLKGPYIQTIIEPPFRVKRTLEAQNDVRENLRELVSIFEKNISRYPKDYFWQYKIWKYGRDKEILVLSDGKAGHLRQSQAVARSVSSCVREKGGLAEIRTLEVSFKNAWAKKALVSGSILSGKHQCQGCLWCLKTFLREDSFSSLTRLKPDMVISCGSALAPVNFLLSRENLAKSIVVMKPSFLSTRRFDLVIIPRHDSPLRRKNILEVEGALNLIDEEYLRDCRSRIADCISPADKTFIGLLIGGDSRDFRLRPEKIREVLREVKTASQQLDAGILVTTSRRTSKMIEDLVREELAHDPRCRLLVIANENNIPEAVGGILGLSRFIICSPESISMISEAASSGQYVFVFNDIGLSPKHREFLAHFSRKGYIALTEAGGLSRKMADLWMNKPAVKMPDDSALIKEAVKKLI